MRHQARIAGDLIAALPDPVVQRDEAGRILAANAAFLRLLPNTSDPIGSCVGPLVVDAGPVTLRVDGVREVDEAIETPWGVRWYAWTETDTVLSDGRTATLRSGREITQRVTSERALQEARGRAEAANQAKSRFLATISHEFRTPLNGILGMASLLVETRLDAEQATYVGAIRSSAEAFVSLIEEVLDFSKIEAGHIGLVSEPFALEPVVQGVVELLAPRAQGKGIDLSGFVSRAVPAVVLGDRDRLRQVLVNLAGNAVKFTETGGVGVSVDQDAATGELVFTVEDTGPGIAPDRLDCIFQEFEQEATPSRESGTGLGLAITRRIVGHMGGDVHVDSTLGRGARFTVRLSLPAGEASEPAASDKSGIDGVRVLILAPQPFQAEFLARSLREAGARVACAETAEDALCLLASRPFDTLIVDCALGEAAIRTAAREARLRGVGRAVVLLSPFERRDLGSPHAAGFDGYLVKPVRARSLLEQVQPSRIPAASADTGGRPTALRPRRSGQRVLLAEDNDVNALLAMKALEKFGAIVDWAKDGIEALTVAEQAIAGERPAYDLILMDVRMPGMDGFAVTRRIREREKVVGAAPSRIIGLSASLLRGDDGVGLAAGFDGSLVKPFTFEELVALLDTEQSGAAEMRSAGQGGAVT
jgi:signal transduction histidine kinase/DNA-binding response OmpR family regulator